MTPLGQALSASPLRQYAAWTDNRALGTQPYSGRVAQRLSEMTGLGRGINLVHVPRLMKPIEELDRVRLLAEVKSDEGVLPSEATGTAVYRYSGGEAFEVEFTAPFHTLLTLRASEVTLARV